MPIFGGMLFRDVPATFAPLDRVPVPENYVVGPGDELMLRAWGSIAFYLRVTVDRSGNIYIPHVGQVQVAGTKFSELRSYLDSQIATSFKKFDLSVEMGQLRAIQIFVVGRTPASRQLHRQLIKQPCRCTLCVGRPLKHRFHAPH